MTSVAMTTSVVTSVELVIQDRVSVFPALKSFLCTFPPSLLSLSYYLVSCHVDHLIQLLSKLETDFTLQRFFTIMFM